MIVGGGFGGLYAARKLKRADVSITLIDRRNHHVFQPFLYQVATAALNPSDIAAPIRRVLRKQRNARVILGAVDTIDLDAKRVVMADGSVDYDRLVIATGAIPSYFGNDSWADHAPGLKDIEDALALRARIFTAFEAAERSTDPESQRAWLTFVVVGGGPTGVELAGSLAEIARHALARDFRNFDPTSARVLLVEAAPRLLGQFAPKMAEKAERALIKLGVEVLTGAKVEDISAGRVMVGTQPVMAQTVIWAAGVSASPLGRSLGVETDRAGRVKVAQDLTVPGHPDVYVIGDLAAVSSKGQSVPGVAPAAIQMGKRAAGNIRLQLDGKPTRPFVYRDKGMLAAIGRASAVASLPYLKLSGLIAWVTWLVIHILYLIGFRNRVLVMIQWAWAYFTYDRGARLITGDVESLLKR